MIAKEELDRITAAQLASWTANKGVIGEKKVASFLRIARLNWLVKMRMKLGKNK